jgi:hypothetical protein
MDRQPTQDGHLLGGERRLASAHGGSDAIASHWSGAVACGVYVWAGCVGVCVGVSVATMRVVVRSRVVVVGSGHWAL